MINETALCYIEEVDLAKNIIIIHCKGVNAPIKLTLHEIINDSILLASLPSTQASWVGFYYGRHYRELINSNNNSMNIFNFSIDEAPKKFNILMLNRQGHLIYSNHENNIRVISPMNAMKCINIITQFNSTQACYIGILAGIHMQTKSIKACYPPTISWK